MPTPIAHALRLAAAGQLVLIGILLLRDHRRSRLTSPSLLLLACLASYLALPALTSMVPGAVRWALVAGAVAVPFAFWLTARIWFDDSYRIEPIGVLLLVGGLAVRMLLLDRPLAASGIAAIAVADALRRVHSGGRSDLLVSRLRLRYVILTGIGLYSLLVLAAEATVASGSRLAVALNTVNDLGLFAVTSAVAIAVLRIEPELVRTGARPAPVPERASVLAKRLERLIEEDRVFLTEGLTIGVLAEKLGEQEYKVRQLINAQLGFRNFGAFLNHYRVREACKVLADPASRALGIAEIAYRHGYSSLGPFNRAFKDLVGQTPTEYRKGTLDREILADSGIGEASSKRR